MSLINWDKSFEIGIAEIDKQHKKLVEIINEFYDELSNGGMEASLHDLLNKVVEYTNYHFQEEERYMASINYKFLEDQKDMHNQIREKMAAFKQMADEGKLTVSMPVTKEIKKWIKEHIQIEDKKIAEMT